jgi:hypothetical protein
MKVSLVDSKNDRSLVNLLVSKFFVAMMFVRNWSKSPASQIMKQVQVPFFDKMNFNQVQNFRGLKDSFQLPRTTESNF